MIFSFDKTKKGMVFTLMDIGTGLSDEMNATNDCMEN